MTVPAICVLPHLDRAIKEAMLNLIANSKACFVIARVMKLLHKIVSDLLRSVLKPALVGADTDLIALKPICLPKGECNRERFAGSVRQRLAIRVFKERFR